MSSANILTARQRCSRRCRYTYPADAGPGDVRRCEHGRYWQWEQRAYDRWDLRHDAWEHLSRFWNPIRRRRAIHALANQSPPLD